jgi:hypothetical protein
MQNSPVTSPYDAAALAAAALAGALAAAVEPGPYDVFGVVISLTLLLVIWAFEKDRPRNIAQSFALDAVSGFVSLLAFGLPLEALAGGGNMGDVCQAYDGQCRPNEFESAVPDTWLAATWMVVSASVALVDIYSQRNRRALKSMA